MEKIKKPFCGYCLTQDGIVYNCNTDKYIYPDNHHCYKLKTIDGKYKTISQKRLYLETFDKVLCEDDIQSLEGEQWKYIYNSKEYLISTKGRVKSYKDYKAIILKPYTNRDSKGYLRVKLSIDGKEKNYFIHKLVMDHFCQDILKDNETYEIHHINTLTTDNRLNNLTYMTKNNHKELHKELNRLNNS